jgi:serine/threonine protein kinase
MNVIHRDVKPANILIDYRGHIAVSDYGTCVQFASDCKVNLIYALFFLSYLQGQIGWKCKSYMDRCLSGSTSQGTRTIKSGELSGA